jgi:hypothetical protein
VRRLVLIAAGFLVLAATLVAGATARRAATAPRYMAYRLVFTGTGHATSAYPATPDGTVFTTSISWTLVEWLSVVLPTGARTSVLNLAQGSRLTGESTGVKSPTGTAIEPGCERIGLSLDPEQRANGGTFSAPPGTSTIDIELPVPGFAQGPFGPGAFLKYSPHQCASAFPTGTGGPGCPDGAQLITVTVSLDADRARERRPLSAQCNIPEQGQTASWTGTLTATRVSVQAEQPGVLYLSPAAGARTLTAAGRVALRPRNGRWSIYGRHCPACGLIGFAADVNGRWLVYCYPNNSSHAQVGLVTPTAHGWDAYDQKRCPIPFGLGLTPGKAGTLTGSTENGWAIEPGPVGYVFGVPGGPAAAAALLLVLG